ncbi:MAG: hypothetical protein ACRDQW_06675 [Haloechinothrix sp.]
MALRDGPPHPPEQQAALFETSLEDLAGYLDCSPAAAAKRLSRARRRLAEAMASP